MSVALIYHHRDHYSLLPYSEKTLRFISCLYVSVLLSLLGIPQGLVISGGVAKTEFVGLQRSSSAPGPPRTSPKLGLPSGLWILRILPCPCL